MAGDWIKMRGNLWDDPRVARLVDITDSSEAAVIGGLYWLWATADQHSTDGVMSGLSTRQIDRKTGVQGLGQALVEIGWLADHPEGVCIVNFEDHNGASAKKRAQTAKRVARHKSANAAGDDVLDSVNAQESETQQEGNAGITTIKALGNALSVSTALPREREEKKKEKHSSAGADPIPPGFARFWESWPRTERKTAKAECCKRWKARRLEALADQIVGHVTAMAQTRQWLDGFEPAPLTYLNQRRWEDGVPADGATGPDWKTQMGLETML